MTQKVDFQKLKDVPLARDRETRFSGHNHHGLWPSRDLGKQDGQLSIKGPQDILDQFKRLCKTERRPYYEMLELLMQTYDDDPEPKGSL
ncbi:hypothetical protein [Celeribacter sp. PS-C1]|uniref:hypothetical protein n=1 Tax=Celeribacter sp. PS-C1 TaxID=2820813 RepID=UPI001CA4A7A1|nr:hypothetical protein [Celeribacter sp. PS-C1]MBW6419332.1 hypothetical protein [Celeribacter sp. PS-C1]